MLYTIFVLYNQTRNIQQPFKRKEYVVETDRQIDQTTAPGEGIWPLQVKDDGEGGDHLEVSHHNLEPNHESIFPLFHELVNPVFLVQ